MQDRGMKVFALKNYNYDTEIYELFHLLGNQNNKWNNIVIHCVAGLLEKLIPRPEFSNKNTTFYVQN